MPNTTPLKRFTFNWSKFPILSIAPRIPIKFFYDDNGVNRETPVIYAVLDSGADEITIPKKFADSISLNLTKINIPVNTASGQSQAFMTKTNFIIGQTTQRTVQYENVDTCVLPGCPDFLVGIKPLFEDYDITIKAKETKYTLEPRSP